MTMTETKKTLSTKKYLFKKQLKKKNTKSLDTKMVLLSLNECGGGFVS